MITINTNVNNLKLQRNLNTVNSTMQNALNRISTGYRINNASDDAAGLVISKALETQTRGLNVANQNAQMATNLLSVADGALGQMNDLAMRIRDLATQSANGVYSKKEREALELEAKELTNNLEQLVKGTKFNDYDIFASQETTKTTPKTRIAPLNTKAIITEAEAIAQGYEIVKTAEELQAVLNAPDTLNNSNKKVMLFGDINLDDLGIVNGNNWEAVGVEGAMFQGIFDGNGYTISNLKINKPTVRDQGFFGYTNDAVIKNVELENVNVKGKCQVGALVAGCKGGSILNSSVKGGNVEGEYVVGGLIGAAMASNISESFSSSNVHTIGRTGTEWVLFDGAGGLLGLSIDVDISNSYATGNVSGVQVLGGLVGCFMGVQGGSSSISNSYSTGNVQGGRGIGGLVGGIASEAGAQINIANSYSTGQSISQNGEAGGFIGIVGNGNVVLNNYAYAKQTQGALNDSGIGAITGSGTISGDIQSDGQDANWFDTVSNIQNILDAGVGANQWDYSTLPPTLKTQTPPTPPIPPTPPKGTPITFQIGTDGTNLSSVSMDLSFTLGNFKPNFTSTETSRTTMEQCDALLKQINTKRGEIGANTNIISSIVDGNTITNENLLSSKSRIQDADIAKESAIMVKNQILESATTSLLSQSSNINGQLALQLLSGLGGK